MCIFIPAPHLTGGQQIKNAAIIETAAAAEIIQESTLRKKPEILLETIVELHDSDNKKREMTEKFYKLLPHNTTKEIVSFLIKIARDKSENF